MSVEVNVPQIIAITILLLLSLVVIWGLLIVWTRSEIVPRKASAPTNHPHRKSHMHSDSVHPRPSVAPPSPPANVRSYVPPIFEPIRLVTQESVVFRFPFQFWLRDENTTAQSLGLSWETKPEIVTGEAEHLALIDLYILIDDLPASRQSLRLDWRRACLQLCTRLLQAAITDQDGVRRDLHFPAVHTAIRSRTDDLPFSCLYEKPRVDIHTSPKETLTFSIEGEDGEVLSSYPLGSGLLVLQGTLNTFPHAS